MKLGNIEVDFSFTDADDLERFENSARKIKEEASKHRKQHYNISEVIKEECKIIDNFFDEVFGEGTSKKLFNNKKDLKEHMKLFTDIVNEKVEQTKAFQNLYNDLESHNRYKPNRETRRYNQYHRKGRK